MQPLRASEISASVWPRDLAVLTLWFMSLLVFSVFQTPSLWTWSGAAFLILYSVWAWPVLKAAAVFLLVSWLYSAVALTPSGLFWLSLFVCYIVTYVAQFRFMIRNVFQFAGVVCLLSWVFDFLQMFLLSQIYPGRVLSWTLVGTLLFGGVFHAVVAFLIYPSVQKWVVSDL